MKFFNFDKFKKNPIVEKVKKMADVLDVIVFLDKVSTVPYRDASGLFMYKDTGIFYKPPKGSGKRITDNVTFSDVIKAECPGITQAKIGDVNVVLLRNICTIENKNL